MAVGTMDKPTGPTGLLKSGKTGFKSGGKKTLGKSGSIVGSPMKVVLGRKLSRSR